MRDAYEYGEDLILRCHYRALKPLGKPYFQFDIRSPRTGVVFGASMIADGVDRPVVDEGNGVIECHFRELPLSPGFYSVDINIRPESGHRSGEQEQQSDYPDPTHVVIFAHTYL